MERHLLLVDDETHILSALRRALRRDGYIIHTAENGAAGLEVVQQQPIGVIVSDQRMPYMTGSDFLARAREIRPHSIHIMLSGFSEVQSMADAINEGAAWKFLFKPWEDEQLRAHIAAAFAHYELDETNRSLNAALQLAGEEMARLNEIMATRFESISADLTRDLGDFQQRWHFLPLAAVVLDAQGIVLAANLRSSDAQLGQLLIEDWPSIANSIHGTHSKLGNYWLQAPTMPETNHYLLLYTQSQT